MLEPTHGTEVVTALVKVVVIDCFSFYRVLQLEICLSSSESAVPNFNQEWETHASIRQDKPSSNELACTGVNRSDISVENFSEPR